MPVAVMLGWDETRVSHVGRTECGGLLCTSDCPSGTDAFKLSCLFTLASTQTPLSSPLLLFSC